MNESRNSPELSHLSDLNAPDSPSRSSLWSYETTVAEVEAIIARIESGRLDLAEVFDQFSEAITHLQQCETFLAERQKQMDLLIETLTDEAQP